jgi:hypothetical protein
MDLGLDQSVRLTSDSAEIRTVVGNGSQTRGSPTLHSIIDCARSCQGYSLMFYSMNGIDFGEVKSYVPLCDDQSVCGSLSPLLLQVLLAMYIF